MNNVQYSILIISVIFAISIPIELVFREDLKTLERLINKNDTRQSVEVYKELTNIEKDEGEKLFLDYIVELEKKVEDGLEDPKVAMEKLSDIKGIKEIDKKVIVVRQNVSDIEKSHMAFNRAKRAEEEEDYKTALENYSYVIKDDKLNYKTARKKMSEIKSILEN